MFKAKWLIVVWVNFHVCWNNKKLLWSVTHIYRFGVLCWFYFLTTSSASVHKYIIKKDIKNSSYNSLRYIRYVLYNNFYGYFEYIYFFGNPLSVLAIRRESNNVHLFGDDQQIMSLSSFLLNIYIILVHQFHITDTFHINARQKMSIQNYRL